MSPRVPDGWRIVPPEEAAQSWDLWLSSFRDSHFRQCFGWGRYKGRSWETCHTALFEGGQPAALGLCLLRRAPLGLATLAWLNGGPAFTKDRPAEANLGALTRYLDGLKAHLAASSRCALRLLCGQPADVHAQLALRQAGFLRALCPKDSGLTYLVDLTRSIDELRAGLDRKWRNQLRFAEKLSPTVEFGRDRRLMERFLSLHEFLCARKGLRSQRLDMPSLEAMARELGQQVVFMLVSAGGQDGCGAVLYRFGTKGYLAISAANELGLKNNLPNAMYWRALGYLKEAGARELDLTGIDPGKNPGVFKFKQGLKGTPVELLGEWDWSPSRWARRALNLAVWASEGLLG